MSSSVVRKLKSKVNECVSLLQNVGLNPIAFICDQSANNRSCINSLGVTVDKPWFLVNNRKVFSFYDPPHLLKNVKTNFKNFGFVDSVTGKEYSWNYVERLFKYDSQRQIRLVPKLTARHVNLPVFSNMSVPLAAQVKETSFVNTPGKPPRTNTIVWCIITYI